MSDPRLSSVHLDRLPRREEFRRARERILGMFGNQTLAQEPGLLPEAATCPPMPAGMRQLIDEAPATPLPSKFTMTEKGIVFALKVGLNTIGRLPDNDIPILDAGVSRRHCAIVVHSGEQCEILDTASKNGTFLNGKRVDSPVPIAVGDEVRVSDRKFYFGTKDAPPVTSESQTFIE